MSQSLKTVAALTAASLATLTSPVMVPSLHLLYFAPFLIYFIYQHKLSQTLWMAMFCGLFLDLLGAGNRLGLIALNFTLSAYMVYQFKRYFFADRLSTLPIMTFIFSSTAGCLQAILNALFQRGNIIFSWDSFFSDMIVMPTCDALLAFVCQLLCVGLILPVLKRRRLSEAE